MSSGESGWAAIIRDWWCAHLASRESGRARALAARLRRAGPIEALAEPEVHELARRLRIGPERADVLSRLVRLLAQLREDDERPLARVLGGGEPVLSPMRFQRLLRARGEEFPIQLRRAIVMAERRCNIGRLGTDVLDWEHPARGEAVRTRWCFEYFGAAPFDRPDRADAATPEETSA